MPNTLTRPTLNTPPAFDAADGYTFTFAVPGTTAQIVANRLTIRNAQTNNVVYDEKLETYQYTHTVNGNNASQKPSELENNTYYTAALTVFDVENNESPASVAVDFWCFTTPTVSITNIPSNQIITNGSFPFAFEYMQPEGERINSYTFNLYNAAQSLVDTSGALYTSGTTEGSNTFSANYTFSGFTNLQTYYVEVVALTVYNTRVSTGLQRFTVQYTQPDTYTYLQLVNNCNEGYITVTSNLILVEGDSNPSPPRYINNNTEVDVRPSGDWVEWAQGFNISGDLLVRIWFRDPNEYTQIAEFSNLDGQRFVVNFMLGYQSATSQSMSAYVEMYVYSNEERPYYIYSNYVDPPLTETQYYVLYLTRSEGIYQLQLLTIE